MQKHFELLLRIARLFAVQGALDSRNIIIWLALLGGS